jgi:hypothetical protein
VCKVFKRKDLLPDFPVQVCGLNAKARLWPGLFSICFYFIEWGITKMPLCPYIFFACKSFCLWFFQGMIRKFGGFWGLTCGFWAENAVFSVERSQNA